MKASGIQHGHPEPSFDKVHKSFGGNTRMIVQRRHSLTTLPVPFTMVWIEPESGPVKTSCSIIL
jgi:hypothetical protein